VDALLNTTVRARFADLAYEFFRPQNAT